MPALTFKQQSIRCKCLRRHPRKSAGKLVCPMPHRMITLGDSKVQTVDRLTQTSVYVKNLRTENISPIILTVVTLDDGKTENYISRKKGISERPAPQREGVSWGSTKPATMLQHLRENHDKGKGQHIISTQLLGCPHFCLLEAFVSGERRIAAPPNQI